MLGRVVRVLERLTLHGLSAAALTGSVAAALNPRSVSLARPPHDVDIVVPSFATIPTTLSHEFLCWHVHPDAPPGRLLLQLVDSVEAIRIDIFGARGDSLGRSELHRVGERAIGILSMEDIAANCTRLLLDMGRSRAVPRKHWEDFERLGRRIDLDFMQIVWPDYRRVDDPPTFSIAAKAVRRLAAERPGLLIVPKYESDEDIGCERCEPLAGFPRTSAAQVRGILGYV